MYTADPFFFLIQFREDDDDDKDVRYFQVEPKDIRVVAKTPNRLKWTNETAILAVQTVYVHPGYETILPIPHDIGILKLKNEISMDGHLAAIIPLPHSPALPGTQCTIVGWGRILSVSTRIMRYG